MLSQVKHDLSEKEALLYEADQSKIRLQMEMASKDSEIEQLFQNRKMYVAPTPFGVVDGVAHQSTLIIPAGIAAPKGMVCVGDIVRRETAQLIVGYRFDLRTNTLTAETVPNPGADREHAFRAWRLAGEPDEPVRLQAKVSKKSKVEVVPDED